MNVIGDNFITKKIWLFLFLLEASELLELFSMESAGRSKRNTIRTNQRRTGRCIIYSYMMADNLQLYLDEIIEEKIDQNNLKYPVEKSAGVRKNTQSCRNVSFGCWKEQKKNSEMSLGERK